MQHIWDLYSQSIPRLLSQPCNFDIKSVIYIAAEPHARCLSGSGGLGGVRRSAVLLLPSQDIECLASDGMLLVSCCLVGQIRVWDAQTGDCLTVIPKQRYVLHPGLCHR